jgi:hypothetical protein
METGENEENLYSCHLVERFLFAICKRFAEDLVRETCSNIYNGKDLNAHGTTNKSSKLNDSLQSRKPTRTPNESSKKDANLHKQQQQQNSHPECAFDAQKFPLYLGVRDIYKTIVHNEKYDFLTNKHMSLDRSARERIEK